MSCNCNGCGQPPKLCRCPKVKGTPRAHIKECSDCDPCKPCESMVKICSFVVPTLTEGQVFRNSFVYNQEDDAVYYITDDGTPIRFGASPMFIDYFDPSSQTPTRQIVFDFEDKKAYIYNPEGEYLAVDLAGSSETVRTLTMSYDENMPWVWSAGGENINYDENSAAGEMFSTKIVPGVTFDEDGAQRSLEDVFNMLKDGEKVVLNHVPLGWFDNDGNGAPSSLAFADGLMFTSKEELYGGEVYSGVATMFTPTVNIHAPFSFSILKYISSDVPVYEFHSQGVNNYIAPN